MKPAGYFIFMLSGLALTLLPAHATRFDSMFCDGSIVSVGDTAGEVIRKCGQPAYTLQREEKIAEHDDFGNRVIITVVIDDWTFNFGPDRFQYRLLLRNGRVASIESLSYGY